MGKSQAKGSAARILFDWESTFKNQIPSGSRYPKQIGFSSFDVGKTVPLNQSTIIRGDRNPAAPFEGNTSVDGSITVALDYDGIGLWLKAMIGEPTTSGPSLGAEKKAAGSFVDVVDGVATVSEAPDTAWAVGDIISEASGGVSLFIYSITSTTVCTVRDLYGKNSISDITCASITFIKTPTFTHTFKVHPTNDLESFVCEEAIVDIDIPLYRLFEGLKVDSGSLNFNSSGDELLATMNVIGTNTKQTVDYNQGGTVAIVCGVATFNTVQTAVVGDILVLTDKTQYRISTKTSTTIFELSQMWDSGATDTSINVSSQTHAAIIGAAVDRVNDGRYDKGFQDNPDILSTDRFEMKDASIKFDGSTSEVFNAFTFEYGNVIDPDSFTIGGGGVRRYLPEGIAGVGGNFDALFEGVDITDIADAGTETSLQLDIEFSATRKITFDFAEVKVQESSARIPGPQGLRLNMDWQAYYSDSSDASAVKVILINGRPSYAN